MGVRLSPGSRSISGNCGIEVIFLNIFPHVFNALAQREGRKTTLPTLASLTGFSETQVQSAIANARRTSETYARQIEVVKVGREWRFTASADQSINYPSVDDVVKEVEMGAPHIWKRVLTALTGKPGVIVSREQLAKIASTRESEITPQQAANAMLTIMRQPIIGQQIEVHVAGRNWRYVDPNALTTAPTGSNVKSVTPSIRSSIYRFMTNNPGKVYLADQIAEDLGFTIKQVQNAMYDIANHNPDFTVVQRGHSWQYTPRVATPLEAKVATNGHTPGATVIQTEAGPTVVPPSTPTATATAVLPQTATTTLPTGAKVPNIPPAEATGARLFEEIGQTTEGALLLKEAETGTFYRATPLV